MATDRSVPNTTNSSDNKKFQLKANFTPNIGRRVDKAFFYVQQVGLPCINHMAMAMKSKKTEMVWLCWISIVAMMLLTSTILVTDVEAEAIATKSNEEVGC